MDDSLAWKTDKAILAIKHNPAGEDAISSGAMTDKSKEVSTYLIDMVMDGK